MSVKYTGGYKKCRLNIQVGIKNVGIRKKSVKFISHQPKGLVTFYRLRFYKKFKSTFPYSSTGESITQ